MKSPGTVKEVQKLTDCLAALGRFLSRSGDKCLYFFQAIKKKIRFEWGENAEATFQKLKEHLHSLPRLVSPRPREVLYMYLAFSDHALSAVLLAERDGIQLPIYFISHVLRIAELRYPLVENFGLALFMAIKKLKPYFLAHPVVIYTEQPLKRPMTTLESSGRMLKCTIKMQSPEISFEPRKAVKGQAFADFIVEMTRPAQPVNIDQVWKLYVDGSSTMNGCDAGVICKSPEGDT